MKEFIAALLLAYLAALLFFPARTLKTRPRLGLFLLLTGVILASPLVIPAGHPLPRIFVGLFTIALPLKLYGLYREPERSRRMTRLEYLAYLPNWFSLVWGRNPKPSHLERATGVCRFLAGGAGLAASLLLGRVVFSHSWQLAPFLLEHAVKATTTYLVALSFGQVGDAFWRLAGQPALDCFDSPHRAVTPADFWRRWNRPVRQFFFEAVFKPLKGFRHPVRATFVTFVISGCIHEYLSDIATGRILGFQMVFFMLQACGVLLTLRLKPEGRHAILGNGLTLLFLLLSSIFFFLSVDAVVPFYDSQRPFP